MHTHRSHATGIPADDSAPSGQPRLHRPLAEAMRSLAIALAFFALYCALDTIVYRRSNLPLETTILSLHTGLSYILILAFGPAYLPCVVLAPALSEWLIDQTVLPFWIEVPRDLLLGLSSALAITLLLHRRVRFDPTLNSLRSVTLLFAAASTDALAAALVLDGARLLAQADGLGQLGRNLADLWVARFLGILLVAPFGMLLLRGRWTSLRPRDWLLHIGAIILLFAGLMLFGGPQPFHAFYLFLLPIVWMATRGGIEAASVGLAVTQIGLIVATRLLPNASMDIFALQSRLLVLSLTGLVVGALVVERLRFEQQLRVHQDALARMARIASMSQMASSIAHEINQPLMAAGTYIRLVTKALEDRPAERDLLDASEKADGQIRRAGEVIRRLRALFKLDRSDHRAQDVAEILRSSLELCRAELDRRSVQARLFVADALPQVVVDRLQIEQVMVNLIQNAAQAIGTNGLIQIAADRAGGKAVEILITDSGPGLPPDLIDGRPVPFFTTKEDGIGVGLALCQAIIEAHGGQLRLANGTSGAQVAVLLPVQIEGKTHDQGQDTRTGG